MRRLILLFTAALCAVSLSGCRPENSSPSPQSIRIGVTVYDQYDTFIRELMDQFIADVQQKERETETIITIMRSSADGSQEAQNNQVEAFLEAGCDVICVNLVDRLDAAVIIDKAETAGVPIVFFNRELVKADLERSSLLYYVGADAFESGRMQGEIVARLCLEKGERIDKNADNIYQYVMLEGEADHQDAVVRTEYSVKAFIDAGFEVERLEDDIANWVRSQAETKMTQWLKVHDDKIEIVFANNDDMALGAIDAFKRAGMPSSTWPVVVGIDGTSPGLEAVKLGELSGTVYNDALGQAHAMLELCYALATNDSLPPLTDDKYIRTPYQIVTPDNVSSFFTNASGAG